MGDVLINLLFILVVCSLCLMFLSSLGRWHQKTQRLHLARAFQYELRRRKLFAPMVLLKKGALHSGFQVIGNCLFVFRGEN